MNLLLFAISIFIGSAAWANPTIVKMNETEFNAAMVAMHLSSTHIVLNKDKADFSPPTGLLALGATHTQTPIQTTMLDPTAVVNDINSSAVLAKLGQDRISIEIQFEENDPEIT